MAAPETVLTGAGRWFFTRRRLALILVFAVALTTPVLLALNWDHKLFFIGLELTHEISDCLSGGSRQLLLVWSGRHPLSHAGKGRLADH